MSVKLVKSARRIFEILELFDRERRAMPAVEIAAQLQYPLASTHEILKTLVELGYFTYGDPKWAYAPSNSIASIVDWTKDVVGNDSRIIQLMDDLNSVTQETINLSRRVDANVKIIKGLESRHAVGVSAKPGTLMPVTQSLTGIASLSATSEEELDQFLKRLRNLDPDQHKNLNRGLVDEIVGEIKTTGSSMRCDLTVEGVGAVCCPIRSPQFNEALVIGIVGPSNRIKEHASEHVKNLTRLLRKHRIETYFKLSPK